MAHMATALAAVIMASVPAVNAETFHMTTNQPSNEQAVSPKHMAVAVVLLSIVAVLYRFANPSLDPREPPPIKPTIPIIGHLLGLMKYESHYFKVLEKYKMGIATLPILNGKIYSVWDPTLISAAHRNKTLSFEPFALEFAQAEMGLDHATFVRMRDSTLVPDFFEGMHRGLAASHVLRMNATALRYISQRLDGIRGADVFEAPNLFLWLRDLMTMATTEALYGPENPVRKDPSIIEDLWTFSGDLSGLVSGPLPSLFVPHVLKARARMQNALIPYYNAKCDYHEDAAEVTRCRADILRMHGITGDDVGKMEIALMHASTANTVPSLFWLISQIFTRPALVERLRAEILESPDIKRKSEGAEEVVTMDVAALDKSCPLLASSYRESMRLANKAVNNRRVLEDTTISDAQGRTYLLKKGTNVMIPNTMAHSMERAWGADVAVFKPERFMGVDVEQQLLQNKNKKTAETVEADKLRRVSYIPFGGGRHLCPGRNFAFAENMGLLASLLLGFDVTTLGPDMKPSLDIPAQKQSAMADASPKPVKDGEGFGVRVSRRPGWENVKWQYLTT